MSGELEKSAAVIITAIERWASASSDAIRTESEKVIMQLKAMPRPYTLCRLLLARSVHPTVIFYAVGTIKDALLREWNVTAASDIAALRTELVQYIVSRAEKLCESSHAHCLNQIIHVVSILFKRGWLAEEQKMCEAVLSLIRGLMTKGTDPSNRIKLIALKLTRSVLSEFASSRSAEVGLSWEFHIKCHRSLERLALIPLFTLTAQLFDALSGSITKGSKWDSRIGIECLEVIRDVLSWEFVEHISDATLSLRSMKAFGSDSKHDTVHPGTAWASLLVQSKFVDVLAESYRVVRAAADEKTLSSLRAVLIQLAGVDGLIFSDPAPASGSAASATAASAPAADSKRLPATASASALSPLRLQFVGRLAKVCSAMMTTCMQEVASKQPKPQVAGSAGAAPPAQALSFAAVSKRLSEELQDVCLFYQRLVYTHGLRGILSLEAETLTKFLTELTQLAVTLPLTDTVAFSSEAFDFIIEAWMHLITQFDELSPRDVKAEDRANMAACLKKYTVAIFRSYLDRRLAVARDDAMRSYRNRLQQQQSKTAASPDTKRSAADDDDDDDDGGDGGDSGLDDQLNNVAIIARMNADINLPLLTGLITHRTTQLANYSNAVKAKQSTGNFVPVVVHEEMYRLIQLTGYVLADPPTGESPTPPVALLRLSYAMSAARPAATATGAAASPASDPIIDAANAVFNYINYENAHITAGNAQPHDSTFVSPLVAQTAVGFLSRWLASYLMPDPAIMSPVPPRLFASWGEMTEGGMKMLEFVLYKASLNLLQWPGEWELAERTCDMLHTLVAMKKTRIYLSKTKSWNSVFKAYVTGDNKSPIMRLRGSALSTLVQAMCYASAEAAYPDEKTRMATYTQVVSPIHGRFQAILKHPNWPKIAHEPATLQQLDVALDMLRGVGRSTGKHAFNLGFVFVASYFDALPHLIGVYADNSSVVNKILSLLCDLAESELQYLDNSQSLNFMRTAVACVDAFGKVNSARLSRITTASKAEETEDDQLEDVGTLLRLLHAIIAKESIDYNLFVTPNPFTAATATTASQPDAGAIASEAVLKALCLLLTHISKLIRYPTVTSLYFGLLESVVTTHPAKFALLPADVRTGMLSSIKLAITNPNGDVSIARSGLKALTALATYHVSTLPNVQLKRFETLKAEWRKHCELREAAIKKSVSAPERKIISLKEKAALKRNQNNALTSTVLTPNAPTAAATAASVTPTRNGAAAATASPTRLTVSGAGARASGIPSPKAEPEWKPKPESPFGPAMIAFQTLTLQMILVEAVSPELVDDVANAMLPLILSAPDQFKTSALAFIDSQFKRQSAASAAAAGTAAGSTAAALPTDSKQSQLLAQSTLSAAAQHSATEVRQRLQAGFTALLSSNGLTLELNPTNLRVFRKNLRTFVQSVRSFIQSK